MEAFVSLSATAAPIDIPNCDTDQIIPARFLRHLHTDGGYDRYLFHDLRFDDTGGEREGFVLNQAAFRSAEIIVADVNWGCGSSRENAVDALLAFRNPVRDSAEFWRYSLQQLHQSRCVTDSIAARDV